jgi:hypothetical protein
MSWWQVVHVGAVIFVLAAVAVELRYDNHSHWRFITWPPHSLRGYRALGLDQYNFDPASIVTAQ